MPDCFGTTDRSPTLGTFPRGRNHRSPGKVAGRQPAAIRVGWKASTVPTHPASAAILVADTELQRWADYGHIAGGVGALIAAFGIVFVWRQVRLQAQDSRTELVTTMTALMISVSGVFVRYPEMRKYFYENKAPDSEDYARAIAIAVTIADAMDHISANLDRMEPQVQAAWTNYMRDIYNGSVILRTYLEDHWAWYGPSLPNSVGLTL